MVAPLSLPLFNPLTLAGFDPSLFAGGTSTLDEETPWSGPFGGFTGFPAATPQFGEFLPAGFGGFDPLIFASSKADHHVPALDEETAAVIADVVAQAAGFLPFIFGGFDPSLWEG